MAWLVIGGVTCQVGITELMAWLITAPYDFSGRNYGTYDVIGYWRCDFWGRNYGTDDVIGYLRCDFTVQNDGTDDVIGYWRWLHRPELRSRWRDWLLEVWLLRSGLRTDDVICYKTYWGVTSQIGITAQVTWLVIGSVTSHVGIKLLDWSLIHFAVVAG